MADADQQFGTVFHLPEAETAYAERVFRNAANLIEDDTLASDITVVCNSSGVAHLTRSAPTAATVRELVAAGVRVCACRNSLGGETEESALVDGVDVVPTAMGELTRRQAAGDAYIRP